MPIKQITKYRARSGAEHMTPEEANANDLRKIRNQIAIMMRELVSDHEQEAPHIPANCRLLPQVKILEKLQGGEFNMLAWMITEIFDVRSDDEITEVTLDECYAKLFDTEDDDDE